MLTVKPSLAKRIIIEAIKHDEPFILISAPGVCKTQLVAQACKETAHLFFDPRISARDELDAAGLPQNVTGDDGVLRTIWARPGILPTLPDTVFFLDEIGCAKPAMQNVFLQLVQQRQAGDHPLPAGNHIGAATNMAGQGAHVHPISSALMSRFSVILPIEPDADDFIAHGQTVGADPRGLAYIKARPRDLHVLPEKGAWHSHASPRTWLEQVFPKLARYPAELWPVLFAPLIGEGLSAQFCSFMREMDRMPDVVECIASPQSAPVPMAHELSIAVSLGISLAYRATQANIGAIVTYLARLPIDLLGECLAFFWTEATRREASLFRTKAYQDYVITQARS